MRPINPPPRTGPSGTHHIQFWDRLLTSVYLMFENLRGIKVGDGSPEGSVGGVVGDLYRRTDGGAGTTLYVKESGAGNTGWVAK